jgi:flagellar biosynthetic protein FliR
MQFTAAEIGQWMGAFVWPWLRLSALLMAAPILGNQQIPVRVRILLGAALAVALIPVVGPVPAVDFLSLQALLIAVQEVLIGVFIGLLLAMAFQVAAMAAEQIALTMGLGFATMVDPQSGMTLPVLSQFFLILVTLLFLSVGGHLMLIELLAESYRSMPVGGGGFARADFMGFVSFGSYMFAGAVLLALPAVVVLLVVQLAMGVMTRAAPQLNIFSVGFPLTMMIGFLAVLGLVIPVIGPRMAQMWGDAFAAARSLLGG